MSPELLGYVIEFSIGLAGFSGVIAVFSGRSPGRIQIELFRLRNLLFGALVPAVLCFVALGIHRAVSDTKIAWNLTLTASILLLSGFVIHALRSRRSMPISQRQLLQPTAFRIALSSLIFAISLQSIALVGIIAIDKFDSFYFGLVVILVIAMYQFVRAVLDGVQTNAPDSVALDDQQDDGAT